MNASFFSILNVFFKIGAYLLGGGYVIIPIMQDEIVQKRKWLTSDEVCDYYCVSQCLSGIIAINMSILVGYKLLKLKGAIAAILGMALSPFIAIIIVANLLNQILHIPFIDGIFWGVNISVIVLIYLAVKEMWQKSIVDKFSAFWFLLILVLSVLKINPITLILVSIALGIIFFLRDRKNA